MCFTTATEITRSKSISGALRKEMVTAPTKGMSVRSGLRWIRRHEDVRDKFRNEAEAAGTYDGNESRATSICDLLKISFATSAPISSGVFSITTRIYKSRLS